MTVRGVVSWNPHTAERLGHSSQCWLGAPGSCKGTESTCAGPVFTSYSLLLTPPGPGTLHRSWKGTQTSGLEQRRPIPCAGFGSRCFSFPSRLCCL